MSDYNPNLGPNPTPGGPDRYGRYNDEDQNASGRSGGILLGVLAVVALIGGFLYFGNPQNMGPDQAQAPTATERALTETPAARTPDRVPLERPPVAIPARPEAPADTAPATPAPAQE